MKNMVAGKVTLRGTAVAAVAMFFMFLHCADFNGGGSEAGNARVVGKVVDKQGLPSSSTIVRIMPSAYDPVKDGPIADTCINTTAGDGTYRFNVPKGSMYTILAVHTALRTRALVSGIDVRNADITVPPCTLKVPGAVKVMLPAGVDLVNGYVYVPGTTIAAPLGGMAGFVMLDSVPAGIVPAVYYSTSYGTVGRVIRYAIRLTTGDTATVAYPEWKYAQQLCLNTTPGGAGIAGNVTGFPVLVRLTSNKFNFSQAQANGGDLRFARSDTLPLPYEIERWDASQAQAEIWVNVDTVYGNNDTQLITMYWGNPDAVDSSDGPAVFDTANGFQGVWHLSEAGNASAYDATGNHYNGTPYNMTSSSAVAGAIGIAKNFDGGSSYLSMVNTSGGKIDFPANGTYSVSAWVNVAALTGNYRIIASKGNKQYNLQLKNTDEWEFAEFRDTPQDSVGWDETTCSAIAGNWVYLAGVRAGAREYLYVNGTCVDSSITLFPLKASDTLRSRDQTRDFAIGRLPDGPSYYFSGKIDEVRVSSIEPGADWIKMCYMNQRPDDKLVVFK